MSYVGRFGTSGKKHPFQLDAVVILPDHLRCIWTLPLGDTDCSMRWNMLKGHFSRAIEKGERISERNGQNGACGNVDYGSTCCEIRTIATNTPYPLVSRKTWQVADWPHSSFHDYAVVVHKRRTVHHNPGLPDIQ